MILAAFANIVQINLLTHLRDLSPWAEYPVDRINTTNDMQGWILLLYFVAYLVSVVSFLVWLRKASRNLTLIGIKTPEFTSGWVVGWWFIPFANLFKPYQVMRNVLLGSIHSNSEDSARLKLKWFWGLHLIGNMISWQAFRATDLVTSNYVSIVGNLLLFAAGVLLVVYVTRVTSAQSEWYSSSVSNSVE